MAEKTRAHYGDHWSWVVEEIMTKADDIVDTFWAMKLPIGIDHVYDLDENIYRKYLKELKAYLRHFLKWAEDYFIKNTAKEDEYPQGCIRRTNRSIGLWERWDWKYRALVPSHEIYNN